MPTDPRNPSNRAHRRDESASHEAARDIDGDDFWGDARSWTQPTTQIPVIADATSPDAAGGGRLSRWWASIAGSGSTATRTHGRRTATGDAAHEPAADDPTPAVGIDPYLDPTVEPSSVRGYRSHRATAAGTATAPGVAGQAARPSSMSFAADHDVHDQWDVDGWHDDARWDDGWDVEPVAAARVGIDPLIGRIGAIALIVTIAVPVVLGFTSQSDASEQLREVAAEATAAGSTEADGMGSAPASTTVESSTAAPRNSAASTTADVSPSTAAVPSTLSDAVTTSSTSGQASAALAATPEPTTTTTTTAASATTPATQPATTQPACGREYEIAAGDYWIRLADASGVRLADLLQVNGATVDTALVPGRTICLPAGASTPSPPPVNTQPATTSRPTTTNAPTTQAPTTQPPTTQPPTTQAPTTTQAPPPPPTSSGDVESIIRSVWPDDLEDHALAIAWRESNYVPTAKNYCCYGLFQIYWEVHDVWLAQHGITSGNQLFDPATNARAAYLLYQRAGGFGPWGG